MFLKFIKSLIVISTVLCSIIILILGSLLLMHFNFYNISIISFKILFGFLVFLLVALRGLDLYMVNNNNDTNLSQSLSKIDAHAQIKYHTNISGHIIRYAELGDPKNSTLLFIHGTPGSLSDAFPLVEKTDILTHYHVIIPDRPGFGGSMRGNDMSNIKEQSELLSELLFLSGNSKKITLIGWSYAGALLPYIAAQYSEKVQSMVIVAGTMDPDHQTIWKISYPLHYTWLRYIIPSMLRVTNAEKLSSIQQLQTLSGKRDKITAPVGLIHGKKDRIVKIENTYFGEQQLKNSSKVITKIVDNADHEIPMTQPQIIVDILKELHE